MLTWYSVAGQVRSDPVGSTYWTARTSMSGGLGLLRTGGAARAQGQASSQNSQVAVTNCRRVNVSAWPVAALMAERIRPSSRSCSTRRWAFASASETGSTSGGVTRDRVMGGSGDHVRRETVLREARL